MRGKAIAVAVVVAATMAGGVAVFALSSVTGDGPDDPEPTITDVSTRTATEPTDTPTGISASVPEPDAASLQALKTPSVTSPSPSPTPTEDPEPDYPVADVQQQLADLGYYRGPIDGEEGPATTSAVMAFQKVQGLAVDGVVGPNTLTALEDPAAPDLRSGPSTRIEVDLTRQVAYFVRDGSLAAIFSVSSGSGSTYTTSSGGTARSLTPVGWYEIERRIAGIRDAPLGILYDPMYFYRGWALHGSNHVPAYPASHGCVRMPRADARWLFDRAPNGTAVHLYGGEHVFAAGSSAPGTDTPAGDTGSEAEPSPSPTPSPEPTPTNQPPAPANHEAAIEAGGSVTIDVIDGHTDPDDGPRRLRVESVADPDRGHTGASNGKVTYDDPDEAKQAARVSFTYAVCDDGGECGQAEVTVTVDPAPSPNPTESSEAGPTASEGQSSSKARSDRGRG